MKRVLRWVARVVGSAVTIILVIVLFPYISRVASRILPDESGAAVRASAILSSKLENSARLETIRVMEDGVLNYDIRAAFVGSVARINVSYTYEASFGVDLSKVIMQVDAGTITLFLPEPELIQDHLTPKEMSKDDFWYPGFSESDYTSILEDERMKRRSLYLNGENKSVLWTNTVEAFDQTISNWLKDMKDSVKFVYLPAKPEE